MITNHLSALLQDSPGNEAVAVAVVGQLDVIRLQSVENLRLGESGLRLDEPTAHAAVAIQGDHEVVGVSQGVCCLGSCSEWSHVSWSF